MLSPRHLLLGMRETIDRRPEVVRLLDHVRAGRVSPDLRITCRGKEDGGGAQVQALAFAAVSGLRYVHSPFQNIAHGGGNADWARRWEDFFNLGDREAAIDESGDRIVPLKQFLADRSLWRESGIIIARSHFHDFADREPDSYRAILPALRRKYALSDKSHLQHHTLPGGIVIAIHLRRGDVGPEMADRYSRDETSLRTIEAARDICAARAPTRLDLYSEGEVASFRRFADAGCELHLDENAFVTLDNLTRADVLVMAKSSFSYVPALLGDSVKLYEKFWHAPMSDWIVRGPDGDFDRARLDAALTR
jgi:hypothetical protein